MIIKETSLKDKSLYLIRDTRKSDMTENQWMEYIKNNNGKTCKIEILER